MQNNSLELFLWEELYSSRHFRYFNVCSKAGTIVATRQCPARILPCGRLYLSAHLLVSAASC